MLDVEQRYDLPSALRVALMLLTPGTVMLFVPRLSRWGRRWIAAVVVFYLVLSSPMGSGLLVRTLSGPYQPIASPAGFAARTSSHAMVAKNSS